MEIRYSIINFIHKWWVLPFIFLGIGVIVFQQIPNIGNTIFNLDGMARILSVFVIANSLISLVIPFLMKRESLRHRRRDLIVGIFALWGSIFLILLEMLRGEPYIFYNFYPDFQNPLTKFAVVIWIFGIYYLLRLIIKVITVDNIHFNKSEYVRCFSQNKPKQWGVAHFDENFKNIEKKIYYPLFVKADEGSRPWVILQRFLLSGMSFSSGNQSDKTAGVYFTFTRPAYEIVEMLKHQLGELTNLKSNNPDILENTTINWEHIWIIDCYSLSNEKALWNDKINTKFDVNVNVETVDAYNPHELNKKYEHVLGEIKKSECQHVRVVYDAISDFLSFTDYELATQYLRHNMGFEQRENIDSLYLFRTGTMKPEKEEYFLWFANGIITIKRKNLENMDDTLSVDVQGPSKTPITFEMNFNYAEQSTVNVSLSFDERLAQAEQTLEQLKQNNTNNQ